MTRNNLSFGQSEWLIERYKEIRRDWDAIDAQVARELLALSMLLGNNGFRLTANEEDWMPPFTPDAE